MSTVQTDDIHKKDKKSLFWVAPAKINAFGDVKQWRTRRNEFIGFTSSDFGNRCGNTNTFNYINTESTKTPQFLKTVIKKVSNYFDSPFIFITLMHANSNRQQRTERRNSCVNVLCFLLARMDIPSMRVGYYQAPGLYDAYTEHYIARALGYSLSRVQRALKDLEKAGLIEIFQRNEKKADHVYRGKAAIKRFTPVLFALLGLTKQLKSARKYFTNLRNKEQLIAATSIIKTTINPERKKKKERKKAVTENESRELVRLLDGVKSLDKAKKIKAEYYKAKGLDP